MDGSRLCPLLCVLLLILCPAAVGLEPTCRGPIEDEQFSEELLLRPLPDGKVLATFFFTSYTPPVASHGRHLTIFPNAIFQLVQKFKIKELELSFTQGRWNYQRWGSGDAVSSSKAKPKGVELWAILGVPDDEVDRAWGDLTNALSGLFSSSINFLESTPTYTAPGPAFRPELSPLRLSQRMTASSTENGTHCRQAREWLNQRRGSGNPMRYGALPREAACTENLTPWLKLLPCRDKAGLTTLLDRPSIYRGFYHSLQVHVRSGDFGTSGGLPSGTVLEQSLTLVLWPSAVNDMRMTKLRHTLAPSWSLQSVFGRVITGSCPLASSSLVYLELEDSLLEALGVSQDFSAEQKSPAPEVERGERSLDDWQNNAWKRALLENDGFALRAEPDRLLRGTAVHGRNSSVLLTYDVSKVRKSEPLDIGLLWKAAVGWSAPHAPFRATRFVTGSGNQKGSMVVNLMANSEGPAHAGLSETTSSTDDNHQGTVEKFSNDVEHTVVNIFQVFPWYIHLYWHTLKVVVDGQEASLRKIAKWFRVQPAEFRKYPTTMEMELLLPLNASRLSMTVAFDKGFLRIDEHPPDANRGFDIPAALITFPNVRPSRAYSGGCEPLLQHLKGEKSIQVYTESLLVPLATPDFSMPYNVATFTSTLLALFFGSVLNVLRRRLGQEERLEGDPKNKKLKLLLAKYLGPYLPKNPRALRFIKLAVVVAVTAGVQYVLTSS